MRAMAFGDKTMIEIPGGQAKAFCEPVNIMSTPSSFMSKESAKKLLIQSAIKNRPLRLQKSLIKFML